MALLRNWNAMALPPFIRAICGSILKVGLTRLAASSCGAAQWN